MASAGRLAAPCRQHYLILALRHSRESINGEYEQDKEQRTTHHISGFHHDILLGLFLPYLLLLLA